MSLEAIVSILFIFKVGAPCPHPPPLFSSGSKSLLFCFCFFSKYNLLQIHRIFLLSFISFCLNKSWRLDLHYDSVAEVLPNVGLTTCLICRVLKKQRSISVVMCSSKVLEYGTFFFTNAFVLPQSSFWCCHLCRRKVYFFFFFSLCPMLTTPITSFARLMAGHILAFRWNYVCANYVSMVTNAWVIVWRSFQQHACKQKLTYALLSSLVDPHYKWA